MFGFAVHASQNMLTTIHGPAMNDIGSRWSSGLVVHSFPCFLAFS
jgi:hypothetical protein